MISKRPRVRSVAETTPPSVPSSSSTDSGWMLLPDPAAAVVHAVRHDVVSQVLRPEMALYLPYRHVMMRTRRDAQCCVTKADRRANGTPVFLDFAKQLPKLTHLDLSFCSALNDRTLAEVSLIDIPMSGDPIVPQRTAQLHVLDVSRCKKVRAAGLAHLAQLPGLQELIVSHCELVDRDALRHIATFPQLSSLDLAGCNGVDANGLGDLSAIRSLRTLVLSGCRSVDTAGLGHVGSMIWLTSLDVSGCDVLMPGLVALMSLHRLEVLNVSSCHDIGTAATLAQISELASIRSLDLSCCGRRLDAEGLLSLLKLRALEELKACCMRLDDPCLRIIGRLPRLTALHITPRCLPAGDGDGLSCVSHIRNLVL